MNVEVSQAVLNNGLTFLAAASGIIVLVVGGFLTKLLFDLSKLTRNLNETTLLVNAELKPTLNELNQALKSFNSIIEHTGNGVGNVKQGLESFVNKTKLLSGNLLGGFLKGFAAVYSLFAAKKK